MVNRSANRHGFDYFVGHPQIVSTAENITAVVASPAFAAAIDSAGTSRAHLHAFHAISSIRNSIPQPSMIALEDGTTVETYLLPRDRVEGRPLIMSGSWRARRRERVA